MNWMRVGDVNTKIFHLMANSRKRKNFIHTLQIENGMANSHQEKQQAIYDHYLHHTCTYVPRCYSLNLVEHGWEERQLRHLDLPFTEDEVQAVIKTTPREKAPVPDGFIGLFF
jgi:hypothetical protein